MRKPIFLLCLVPFIVGLWIPLAKQITSPPATLNVGAAGTGSPMAGCTVSTTNTINYGVGGCPANMAAIQAITGGATWTQAAVQGFDDGALPPGQIMDANATIDCSGKWAHTGNCAAITLLSYNGATNRWYFGPIIGREYLLSYWDNCHGCVFNEEYTLNHVEVKGLPTSNCGSAMYPQNLGGCTGTEEMSQTWLGNDLYSGSVGGFAFNSLGAQDSFGPQGNYEVTGRYGPTFSGYGSGGWHQIQVWLKSNTADNTDGFMRMWIDGVSYWGVEGANFTGHVDMTGMTVDAGGYYTKNNWVVNSAAGGTAGYPSALSIENKQPSCEGVVGAGCVGTCPTCGNDGCTNFGACAAGQNVPETERVSDDIILWER